MPRSILVLAVLAVVSAGSIAVGAAYRCHTHVDASASTQAGAGAACEAGPTSASAAPGGIAGRFDAQMAGCRFACGTKQDYQASDVHTQPGACAGNLTQCPVSGVVFAVDEGRPHVRIGQAEYVTCCDKCAQKLKRDPGRYLKT